MATATRSPVRRRGGDRPGLTEEEIEEIRESFNLFDTDGSGRIDPKELKAAMQSLGFESKNPTIYRMIADLDSHGKSSVDFEEFLDAITSKLGDKESRDGIQKIFALFDDDKTGTISLRNLKRVAKELGETMSDDELREMIERADGNGDGEISFEDFYTIMTKKTFPVIPSFSKRMPNCAVVVVVSPMAFTSAASSEVSLSSLDKPNICRNHTPTDDSLRLQSK
eukprot:Lankesteria_metandrocarpae@DN3357_c0_g1_i2.p1